MSDASLHLILGEEELLVDRAVAQIVSDVRTRSETPGDLPVSRLRAGDAGVPELAELLSPSLFAEERIVILESTADAGKDAAALILDVAGDPPPGVTLVILHSGGGRTKAMVPALRKCGAEEHMCAAPAKAGEKAAWVRTFVHKEFQAAGVRVSGDVEQLVIEAVGSDLRELAAACSQLVADTGGKIDAAAVRRYYSGKAEVSGFDVAEKAVAGDTAGALEALRWAMHRGVAHVLLADALADAVHTIARVGSAGRGDPFSLASSLGMPPWKVKKAQAQARTWASASIGTALTVVAALNADVKGAAADPDYALEHAVRVISELAA
ncbi:DNA polymerase III, delta subunit [Rhodococcus rhodochrous J3]|uniref:DNA-directed DNA polymerase n=2 Tax=Rhodococcus rhodochrous TaxID=1829 RepID=A0AA46WSQ0_RHORH|nr:DNA polymerase III subunit delta [Rhodococcus rhodochrous]UZF43472.1 DNA polymerase III subunit delta [Rhodococcus rhodochrous]SMG19896.1 DNA polymerase III, delta subunit [Rhodococcus rhodochrous J3]